MSIILNLILKNIINLNADNRLIKQVFSNIVLNAIKYSSCKEKIIIEISSFEKDDKIVYYIKDNGIGFDEKYNKSIFNAFEKLHNKVEIEGLGIGLSIVKRIIAKHKGEVWADSIENEGATFYFSLPK